MTSEGPRPLPPEIPVDRHEFSPLANRDELAYRNEVQLTQPDWDSSDKWCAGIEQDGFLRLLPWLLSRGYAVRGEGVDLGAGVCWLSAQLSQLPSVTRVHALEFSEAMLTRVAPAVIEHIGGIRDKISLHVGDIHDLSMFKDASLGFVSAAAVLHHATDLDLVLREARRVIEPSGLFFALEEPGIPPIITPFTREQSEEGFGTDERAHGVTEHTYRERDWRAAFERAGFDVKFLRRFNRRGNWRARLVRYTPLRFTNGLLFWSKLIVARPRP